MKRFCSMLAVVLMLTSACAFAAPELRGYNKKEGYQYIQFGAFPQEADGTVKPILWRILQPMDLAVRPAIPDGRCTPSMSEAVLPAQYGFIQCLTQRRICAVRSSS